MMHHAPTTDHVSSMDDPQSQTPQREFGKRVANSLGSIISNFKAAVTRRANPIRANLAFPFWQRNYYEHIIRNERALHAIYAYIENNPPNWPTDQLHPHAPQQI